MSSKLTIKFYNANVALILCKLFFLIKFTINSPNFLKSLIIFLDLPANHNSLCSSIGEILRINFYLPILNVSQYSVNEAQTNTVSTTNKPHKAISGIWRVIFTFLRFVSHSIFQVRFQDVFSNSNTLEALLHLSQFEYKGRNTGTQFINYFLGHIDQLNF